MHAQRTFFAWLVLLVLALNCTRGVGAAAASLTEVVLEVSLRADLKGETMVVLRGPDGSLYLEENDFAKLRLHAPETPPHVHGGVRYFAPADIKGCSVAIDEARQRAIISAPATAFATSHMSVGERQSPTMTQASPGAFLNYQLSAQQIASQTTGGAFGELGVFAGAGVLTNTVIGRAGNGGLVGDETQLVRLDTTFTRDFPDRLETLNVGDAISDGGSWGNALRYAGIRWSRNFGLRPDLLTTPLLSTAGTAVVPSTVDVFVNNQLVTSNQVPAGPFVIDRLPTVSGSGDVNVVVRDAFGREQVVTQSFYSSVSLLARDLTQYSFNVGRVRDDYGVASEHYGATLAEMNYRRGITDDFTLEGHGEYLAGDAHAAGLNAAWRVGHFGIVNITAASGGDAAGSGWLSGVGFEHRGANASFVVNSLWASSDFDQVGESLDTTMHMRQRSLMQGSVGLGRFGSLSLAYARQTYRSSPTQQTLGLTHSLSFGHAGTLNLSISRSRAAEQLSGPIRDSTSAYLIYVFAIDGRHTASTTAIGGSGSGSGVPQNEIIAGFAESPTVGPGSGYRLSASSAGNYDADWRQQFSAAAVEVEAARNQGIEGRSAIASGAVTWLDGEVNTTRSVNGSFAMVDVAGLPNVPVYVENQLTTHTDASGHALLYNLRPYESNRISIAPEDLPLDTAIAASSTVMAPPYRSGVVARFPVERIKSATFRLVTDDGKPVPVGATVTLMGTAFPVVQDGVVYVTGYDHGMSADAAWPGGHCTFRLQPPPDEEPIPDLGTIHCRQKTDVGAGR